MEQDKIWDYFQNEGLQYNQFPEARQRFVASHLKPGIKVLNIGVGGGALERIATEKGTEMYSLDPSERAIERLRNELGMGDRARAGYAQNIPFDDEQFDVVVMSELIEHLDDETINAILPEVFRVLKPGGSALVTTPFNERLSDRMAVCPDCGKVFHRIGHVQSFTKERVNDFFIRHHFNIQKTYVTTFIDWQRKGLFNFIKSIIRLGLGRMGQAIASPSIVVFARRPTR